MAIVFARVLAALGRTLITAGVLILLFVAYQLWGTGIRTAQAQNDLERRFAEELAEAEGAVVSSTTTSTPPPSSTTTLDPAVTTTSRLPATTAPPLPPDRLPERGDPVGRIVIDRIGVDWIFVEGVSVSDLKEGPGHYPGSPLPGQAGNAAIAGHRTTYGAPFHDIDQLEPGDEIRITTLQGEFTYLVRATEIVRPSQTEVLAGDHWGFPNALTLTACHPKYSARQRIVVGAELVGDPAASTPRPERQPGPRDGDDGDGDDDDDGEIAAGADAPLSFESGLSGDRAAAGPTVAWGILCAAVWIAAWGVGRRWRRLKWPSYVIGLAPFLVALFFFFEEFSRLLPANY